MERGQMRTLKVWRRTYGHRLFVAFVNGTDDGVQDSIDERLSKVCFDFHRYSSNVSAHCCLSVYSSLI